jgi:hypothetical protein
LRDKNNKYSDSCCPKKNSERNIKHNPLPLQIKWSVPKPLYCAFIDYRKVFDSVDRLALWHKLLQNYVDGRMFKIIHYMYDYAKSCVRKGSQLSEFFNSNVGVRQGVNLSPVLISLFLNDLVEFISHAYDGLTNICNATHIFLDI